MQGRKSVVNDDICFPSHSICPSRDCVGPPSPRCCDHNQYKVIAQLDGPTLRCLSLHIFIQASFDIMNPFQPLPVFQDAFRDLDHRFDTRPPDWVQVMGETFGYSNRRCRPMNIVRG